jgi:hypothetical protein
LYAHENLIAPGFLIVQAQGTPAGGVVFRPFRRDAAGRAEMEALAALPGIRSVRLSRGELAVHEEFPDATAETVEAFLRDGRTGSNS